LLARALADDSSCRQILAGVWGRGDTISDPISNLHCAPNGNIVNGQYAPGADGFNLADVSSVSALNALPAGVKRLVWLKRRLGRHRVH